jgi:hypothetical protein
VSRSQSGTLSLKNAKGSESHYNGLNEDSFYSPSLSLQPHGGIPMAPWMGLQPFLRKRNPLSREVQVIGSAEIVHCLFPSPLISALDVDTS